MQQDRDTLLVRAVLVMPGEPSPDVSAVAEPLRIPVRIVWRKRASAIEADLQPA